MLQVFAIARRGGLSGPVVSDKEYHGFRQIDSAGRSEYGEVERVLVQYREPFTEDLDLCYVHNDFQGSTSHREL
jgi:hypothetical protein